jgi:hypothetical protein
LQHLEPAVQKETIDAVRFHTAANAIRCLEEAEGHAFIL